MVEKILNNTTPYGKIRASHEGSLHSSTLSGEVWLMQFQMIFKNLNLNTMIMTMISVSL